MNNIKVTVEYETPKTNKFDELMTQYETIKQTADETVAYYKPLADMAEETKLLAIREQCKTIVNYLEKLHAINSTGIYDVMFYAPKELVTTTPKFKVKYDGEITWCGYPFTVEKYRNSKEQFNSGYHEDYNILGNWDKWNVYTTLENKCLELLNAEIAKQKNRGEKQKNRLNNITGGYDR